MEQLDQSLQGGQDEILATDPRAFLRHPGSDSEPGVPDDDNSSSVGSESETRDYDMAQELDGLYDAYTQRKRREMPNLKCKKCGRKINYEMKSGTESRRMQAFLKAIAGSPKAQEAGIT